MLARYKFRAASSSSEEVVVPLFQTSSVGSDAFSVVAMVPTASQSSETGYKSAFETARSLISAAVEACASVGISDGPYTDEFGSWYVP